MTRSSVTPIRAGTKALPEKVFEACNQLAEAQGSFKNEEVLAITKGGMATVSRLVKAWRQHQHIIRANDALSAEATITLVEMVDKLVQQQIAQSESATTDFLNGAAEEITELSQALETRELEVESLKEEARVLRTQLKENDDKLTTAKIRLEDRDRELADTKSRLELVQAELKQAQSSHAAKIEQLGSQHQHQVAQALEVQRRSMEAEKFEALNAQELAWKNRLAEARAETEKAESNTLALQTALRASQEDIHASKLRNRELESEINALKRLHQEQLQNQQAIVDEKQEALVNAQAAQKQLTMAIERQLTNHNEEFAERLHSLAGAANNVTSALTEIDALLKDIRRAARPSGGTDTGRES